MVRVISGIYFLLLTQCCFLPSAFAQSHPDSVSYLKSYLTNTGDIIKEPFHWNKKDFANLGVVSIATATLMIYDEQIDDFMYRNQNETLSNISKYVISPFGNGVYSLPLLGAVYVSGVIGKNTYDKEMALLGVKAFVISAAEATVIKAAFQRHRPIDDTPPDAFQYDGPFHGLDDNGSFVSRHATTAFAIATVFAEGYKTKKKWVPYVAYSLASLVSISRVYDREHWASDAFAGACLGYFTGKFLYKINYGYKFKKVSAPKRKQK